MATPTYKFLAIPIPPDVIIDPVEMEEESVVDITFNVVPDTALVDIAVKADDNG